jgi:tRNA pseudouridine65 synthase
MSRRLHVLAQGDGWIAVAKPPALLVHRSEATPHASAALQIVRDQTGAHVYPIHRLDRSASGCLLFATDRALAGPLSAALTAGRKTYLAFVRGAFQQDGPVVVDTPMKDDNDILKDARSTVWCLGRSHDPRCSLLKVEPETGRFHQVRRHVRDLHHPVIGDTDHGDTKVNRWWRENMGATRLGLHALAISLPAGADSPAIDVVCPLFADHARVWSALPWWADAVAKEPALALPPLGVRVRKPPRTIVPPPPAEPPTDG